jgi:hypothetical protein
MTVHDLRKRRYDWKDIVDYETFWILTFSAMVLRHFRDIDAEVECGGPHQSSSASTLKKLSPRRSPDFFADEAVSV